MSFTASFASPWFGVNYIDNFQRFLPITSTHIEYNTMHRYTILETAIQDYGVTHNQSNIEVSGDTLKNQYRLVCIYFFKLFLSQVFYRQCWKDCAPCLIREMRPGRK